VPTHGGAIGRGYGTAGPRDQRAVEVRPDVLVYTAPAFDQDTEVTGPVSLEIFVSSSAVDTDFTAKLVDVWPSGFAQNLSVGMSPATASRLNPLSHLWGNSLAYPSAL
jgi:uncharacterized protein